MVSGPVDTMLAADVVQIQIGSGLAAQESRTVTCPARNCQDVGSFSRIMGLCDSNCKTHASRIRLGKALPTLDNSKRTRTTSHRAGVCVHYDCTCDSFQSKGMAGLSVGSQWAWATQGSGSGFEQAGCVLCALRCARVCDLRLTPSRSHWHSPSN